MKIRVGTVIASWLVSGAVAVALLGSASPAGKLLGSHLAVALQIALF